MIFFFNFFLCYVHTHIARPQQALPQQSGTSTLLPTHVHQQTMTPLHTVNKTPSHTHNAHNLQTKPLHSGNGTPSHTHPYPQHTTVKPAGKRISEPTQQSMLLHTGKRTPLQTLDANTNPTRTSHDTPLSSFNAFSPPNQEPQKKGEYVSLLEDDSSNERFEMSPPTAAQNHNKSEEWESFARHFTAEFEALKGEVEMLRTEVRQLKLILREAKVTSITATYYSFKKHKQYS